MNLVFRVLTDVNLLLPHHCTYFEMKYVILPTHKKSCGSKSHILAPFSAIVRGQEKLLRCLIPKNYYCLLSPPQWMDSRALPQLLTA